MSKLTGGGIVHGRSHLRMNAKGLIMTQPADHRSHAGAGTNQ